MAINLNVPLRWKAANAEETAMLEDLQGNILKGHGRHVTRHIFLRFNDADEAKRFIRNLEPLVMSAAEQLRQAEAFKATGASGGAFVAFFLSSAGYGALGLDGSAPSVGDGGAFEDGMGARAGELEDPPEDALDEGYRGPIHAMVLIAGDADDEDSWTSSEVDQMEGQILGLMGDDAEVVASESGRAVFNEAGEGLEHFGYVDGRSQPLMLVEDIEKEEAEGGGIDVWSPATPLGQVLVKDPGSNAATAFGSYFVFRKLEQNVKGFKAAETKLGQDVGSKALAGAMLVGRWKDGTSVHLSGSGGLTSPISNNFDYSTDEGGAKCPIHGHTRKTNPRGESEAKFGLPPGDEHAHLMARRGIPYGRRSSVKAPQDEPEGGVGLLFMAYQSNLANQFEFTQSMWANNENFVDGGAGRDPIIGQGSVSTLRHGKAWGDADAGFEDFPFGGFVAMKGGEYFFAPAKSTLAGL